MAIKNEDAILQKLSELKWGEEFQCSKPGCGHNEYKKGKKPYSRRCKKCDYEESLVKFTAFEGLRFPVEKAYRLLDAMYHECYLDWDEEIFDWRNRIPRGEKSEGGTSLNQASEMLRDGWIHGYRYESIIARAENVKRMTLKSLSKLFDLEENSVSKLLAKVNTRIKIGGDADIVDWHQFIRDHPREFEYLIGLLIIPLDEHWRKGKREMNGQVWYLKGPDSISDRWIIDKDSYEMQQMEYRKKQEKEEKKLREQLSFDKRQEQIRKNTAEFQENSN